MGIEITEMLLTVNKYSRPGIKRGKTTKIAVHYVGNPGSSAVANRNYFENLKDTKATYVSSNYIIGLRGEVIRCVPDDEIAYCTNSANAYSISIECCHPDSTGKFNAATESSLAELCAYLCSKYGLTEEDIIRHYDVTGKKCPLWYVNHPEAFAALKKRVALLGGKSAEDTANDTAEDSTDSGKLYYVQVGAFKSKANAEAYLKSVRADYPGAFIKVM